MKASEKNALVDEAGIKLWVTALLRLFDAPSDRLRRFC
jgi:hypothetical protein